MKHLLIVSATLGEVLPLYDSYRLHPSVSFLFTGVGMTNTAYHLGKSLALRRPDFCINLGIAGSFDWEKELGTVVEVVEDSFSELGAEDHEAFLDMEALGFPVSKSPTHTHYNTFYNPHPSDLPLPKVTGITVNTVHGNEDSIRRVQAQWNKDIETMEGAAFFQIMQEENLPFFAFRALSNYVEPRNKSRWQIPLAIQHLNRVGEIVIQAQWR
jgi:futalosine hydrolase